MPRLWDLTSAVVDATAGLKELADRLSDLGSRLSAPAAGARRLGAVLDQQEADRVSSEDGLPLIQQLAARREIPVVERQGGCRVGAPRSRPTQSEPGVVVMFSNR